ncbi:RagB/SusD family nutrient uptake outer membrane protein [Pedobacter frigoris]|uniref:RagB/SusD family nutrient uptake outer membrane protein n=1 Tax=Pedobacter frigoris TaxID=2571272 RepID=A0A4U1CQ24_9SPHI|nr:RagB/SusD family nutrient uptake outer membrane protein [Pedobacter frigoris]TKC09644.1 RagB/SusD family nutrient uptake outer membrane protein [Pedobacter frigoris]
MKSSYITTLGIMLLLTGVGCTKFLEKEPARQTTIQTVDQMRALMDNPNAAAGNGFYEENNSTVAFSTDDTEIPADVFVANVSRLGGDRLLYYTFDIDQIIGLSGDPLWTGEYRKIFVANTVLDNLDEAIGTAAEKAALKADAHFYRAYSYWVLANYYCLPYSPANLASPGLTLKKTSNMEESLKRATLDETYQFILSELNEAMNISTVDVDPTKRWRVTKRTVDAMLSRYYLCIGDYPNALDYANKALASTSVVLKDYKTIVAAPPIAYTNPTASLEVPETYNWTAVQYIPWPELYYPRFAYTANQFYMPSASLRALYEGQNDLRYKWFVIENGGRRFSIVTPQAFRYVQFDDGRRIVSGLSRAEMLLNKAEALARTNKPAEAMIAVNELRAKRFTTPTDLTAANTDQAIANVLAERRREFPFAMRWIDIKRFSVNNYPADDVTITRDFFQMNGNTVDVTTPKTYTLSVGSRRYAVPINGLDVSASNGQIPQNTY